MKQSTLLFSTILFPLFILAQNQTPSIENLEASVDGNILTLTYDVQDTENDDLEIIFQVSADEGATYTINTENATGDLGFPVTAGAGKSITWDFSGVLSMTGDYRIKIIADDRQVVDIQEIVDQVDSNRLRMDLEMIEGVRHPVAGLDHLEAVKDMLTNHFNDQGLETEVIAFNNNNYTAENIIGWKRGQVTENDTYIIDGHFDTVDESPGADDNGSAVAGVMEALRVLAPYQFKKSIKFIGFDLEEAGLLGSFHHVNTEGIKPNENIAGVFNLEMIGYYSEVPNSQVFPSGFELLYPDVQEELEADQFRGNFITNIGIESFPELAQSYEEAATSYVPDLKVITLLAPASWLILTPDLGRSDHAPFWIAELPALMLTDGSEFRYPYYHTPNDTIGNLNFTFMSNVVKATVAAVAELAELSHSTSATTDIKLTTSTTGIPGCLVRLSPNPNTNFLRVDLTGCAPENIQVDVYNLSGRLVYSQAMNSTRLLIPTKDFPTGTYLLKLKQGTSTIHRKVIVSR